MKSVSNEINLKSIITKYVKYYKENLMIKHIICFIIMCIIFAVSLYLFYNNASIPEVRQTIIEKYTLKTFFADLNESIFLSFIIIFAGFTPYIYLSVLGLFYGYNLASIIIVNFVINEGNLVLLIIGGIIQIIGISLSVATGINYCKLSTNRKKYNSRADYGINDIKKAYYNIRNNKEGVEKVEESNRIKYEKKQNLDIKIPYFMYAISFALSLVFILISKLLYK